MINLELIGLKLLGIVLVILGIFWIKSYKRVRYGQEPFTDRKVIETTINHNSVIGGICLIALGIFIIISP